MNLYREQRTRKLRWLKWSENPRCHYCGRVLQWEEATLDHIIPRSKGGQTTWKNTTVACWPCNNHKANGVYLR